MGTQACRSSCRKGQCQTATPVLIFLKTTPYILPKRNYIPTWQSRFQILNAKTLKKNKKHPGTILFPKCKLKINHSRRYGSSQSEPRKVDISVSIRVSSMDSVSPPSCGLQAAEVWGHHTHEQLHCRLPVWVGKRLFGLSLLVFTFSKHWSWEERVISSDTRTLTLLQ